MQIHKNILIGLIVAAFCYSPASYADKGGKEHGRGHEKSYSDKKYDHDKGRKSYKKAHDKDDRHRYDHDERYIVSGPDRLLIRQYIVQDYRRHCPPGLAKKRNGCLPPGHARHYVIGQPLYVEWEPVPEPLLVRLRPVPVGYQYVMIDRDVLLISEASKKVIDAITLMSAVSN